MKSLTFTFRNAGPSGRGVGRIRYFVDAGDRCIGSIEGKTGDFRLDADYGTEGARARKATTLYPTRIEAARALAEITTRIESPPLSADEYRILQRCKTGEVFEMPVLGFARILCSRGMLTQKRGTNEFRTTDAGLDMIGRHEIWVTQRQIERQKEHP